MPAASRISMTMTRATGSFFSGFHDQQPYGPSIYARQRRKTGHESASYDRMHYRAPA
jgi:hypothetical protein